MADVCTHITKKEINVIQPNVRDAMKPGGLNIGSMLGLKVIIQSIAIFQNTSSEVVKDKTDNNTILGTATESILLEFGLLEDGDLMHIVEPSNSVRNKMSVLVSLPNRGVRAFCKGASEIILRICDKIIDSNGNDVDLPEEQANKVNALRTLSVVVKDIDATEGENSILDNGYTLIISKRNESNTQYLCGCAS
ncbi:hypothetical protein HN51_011936 [Arachis hypogaea]